MNAFRDKPLAFPWPPVVYGVAILAALMLQRYLPVDLPDTHIWIARSLGAALVVLALFLDVWAMRTLIDSRTTVMPHRRSAYLVTRGPYRFTRNPIYLGYTLTTAGAGLITQNPWFLPAAIVAVIATTLIAVRREEKHLLSRFGIDFERYCRRTARWI